MSETGMACTFGSAAKAANSDVLPVPGAPVTIKPRRSSISGTVNPSVRSSGKGFGQVGRADHRGDVDGGRRAPLRFAENLGPEEFRVSGWSPAGNTSRRS